MSASFAFSAARYEATGFGAFSEIVLSVYVGCITKSLSKLTFSQVRTIKCVASTKVCQKLCLRFSRPRRGSSPSLARRALEAGYPVSPFRGQDPAFLRSGARHSEHHAEDARPTASSYGVGRHRRAQGLSSSAPKSRIQSHGMGAVPMPSTRRVPEVGRFTAAAERRTSSRAYCE